VLDKILNRRTVLAASGAVAGATVLTRGGLAQPASPAATGWSFTDDKGVTVELAEAPVRIVADVNAAAALWDFGIRPVGIFGWNASDSGDLGPAGGNIDPTAVEIGGNSTEPFQLEPVLAMQPDLLVTLTWEPENPTEYWSLDAEESVLPLAQEIAPIVAISAVGLADANTGRMAELAAALGADLETPELVAASEEYDAALAQLPEVAAEQADLTVMFAYISRDGEQWYIVDPAGWADVSLYESLGVNVIIPETSDGYWQTLSFEEALKYPADVIFNSSRGGGTLTLNLEELQAHPTFGQHPAVAAGQVGDWNQDFIMSYQGMTDALNAIITTLAPAEKVIE
jgi:iron complex transport system substrate-binding protein